MINIKAQKIFPFRSDSKFQTEDVDQANIGKEEKEEDDDEEESDIDMGADDNLDELSKEELLQKAKDVGLDVNSDMSKEELINKIRKIKE